MKIPLLAGMASLLLVAPLSCSRSPQDPPTPSLTSRVSTVPGLGWLQPVTPVGEISSQSAPSQTLLQGEVQQQAPLINQWLYLLQDASGGIWVLTSTPPPAIGETVSVRVQIRYEPILMQGNDIGEYYAEELERLVTPETES